MRRPIKRLQEGAIGAAQILLGEAAARAIPSAVGLQRAGPLGLAIQAVAALVAGAIADKALGAKAGAMVLAGGLSAPIKTAVISYNVPWLAQQLSPAAVGGDVSGYLMGRYPEPGVGRYPSLGSYPRSIPASLAGAGMGTYYRDDEEQVYYHSSGA